MRCIFKVPVENFGDKGLACSLSISRSESSSGFSAVLSAYLEVGILWVGPLSSSQVNFVPFRHIIYMSFKQNHAPVGRVTHGSLKSRLSTPPVNEGCLILSHLEPAVGFTEPVGCCFNPHATKSIFRGHYYRAPLMLLGRRCNHPSFQP